MNEKVKTKKSKANLAIGGIFLLVLMYLFLSWPKSVKDGMVPAPSSPVVSNQKSTSTPLATVTPRTLQPLDGDRSPLFGGVVRTDNGGIKSLEQRQKEHEGSGLPSEIPTEMPSSQPQVIVTVPLPPEYLEQMKGPPPELPPDFKRQLEEPPPELPADLKAQLEAPPPEVPEDIKRQLAIPPRIVTLEEVNTFPTQANSPMAPPGPTSTPPEEEDEE